MIMFLFIVHIFANFIFPALISYAFLPMIYFKVGEEEKKILSSVLGIYAVVVGLVYILIYITSVYLFLLFSAYGDGAYPAATMMFHYFVLLTPLFAVPAWFMFRPILKKSIQHLTSKI